MKLIALIRDPVERAWSNYRFHLSQGTEKRRFDEVVSGEMDHLQRSGEPIEGGLLDVGRYSHHISRFLQEFPLSQIKVLTLESLVTRERENMTEVFEFLNVDPELGNPEGAAKLNAATVPLIPVLAEFITQTARLPDRRTKRLLRQLIGQPNLTRIKKLASFINSRNQRESTELPIPIQESETLRTYYETEDSSHSQAAELVPSFPTAS